MEENNELKLFENQKIRAKWDEEQEKWYFSVVDVVAVLTDNDYQAGRKYWSVLKTRLKKEGSELTTNCSQLKMKSVDGKYYNTDVMTTEQILRLIQSIPSKKAEPFKLWLAQVGKEIPENLMREMRSTVIIAGALLGRFKEVTFSYPGGCDIWWIHRTNIR